MDLTEKIYKIFNENEFIKLSSFSYGYANLLLMSSGNFDGADMLTFANQVTGSNI